MKRILLSMGLLMLVAGCGGGGGSKAPVAGGGPEKPDWDLKGVYSFVTGEISYTCDDGYDGMIEGDARVLEVFQLENQLIGWEEQEGSGESVYAIEFDLSEQLAGVVENDESFTMRSKVVYTIKGYSGRFTAHHKLEGQFTTSGWSGHYTYSIYNDQSKRTCDYSSQFTGELLTDPVPLDN